MGSMVVFEDGAPRKDAYRKFSIRGEDGTGTPDDTTAMNEVLRRRFERLIQEENGQSSAQSEPNATTTARGTDLVETKHPSPQTTPSVALPPLGTEREPRRFSYRPDLVVVDGALPQVHAARAAMDEVGVWDIPVIGLAKRLEEVWRVDDDFPVIFPRNSEALYLLQYLRDESHRFAISAHRQKRARAMTRSILDAAPGVGPSKQKALLRHFGSVKRLREASATEIAEVPGFGLKSAENLVAFLNNSGNSGKN